MKTKNQLNLFPSTPCILHHIIKAFGLESNLKKEFSKETIERYWKGEKTQKNEEIYEKHFEVFCSLFEGLLEVDKQEKFCNFIKKQFQDIVKNYECQSQRTQFFEKTRLYHCLLRMPSINHFSSHSSITIFYASTLFWILHSDQILMKLLKYSDFEKSFFQKENVFHEVLKKLEKFLQEKITKLVKKTKKFKDLLEDELKDESDILKIFYNRKKGQLPNIEGHFKEYLEEIFCLQEISEKDLKKWIMKFKIAKAVHYFKEKTNQFFGEKHIDLLDITASNHFHKECLKFDFGQTKWGLLYNGIHKNFYLHLIDSYKSLQEIKKRYEKSGYEKLNILLGIYYKYYPELLYQEFYYTLNLYPNSKEKQLWRLIQEEEIDMEKVKGIIQDRKCFTEKKQKTPLINTIINYIEIAKYSGEIKNIKKANLEKYRKIIKLIIKKGSDQGKIDLEIRKDEINQKLIPSKETLTALLLASGALEYDIVKLLLESGVHVNAISLPVDIDFKQEETYQLAKYVVSNVHSNGSTEDTVKNHARRLVQKIFKHKKIKMVTKILDDIDCNSTMSSEDFYEKLIQKLRANYQNALHFAVQNTNENIEEVIKSDEERKQIKDSRYQIVKLLLEKGCDPDHQDYWGSTPLDYAKTYFLNDVCTLLQKYSQEKTDAEELFQEAITLDRNLHTWSNERVISKCLQSFEKGCHAALIYIARQNPLYLRPQGLEPYQRIIEFYQRYLEKEKEPIKQASAYLELGRLILGQPIVIREQDVLLSENPEQILKEDKLHSFFLVDLDKKPTEYVKNIPQAKEYFEKAIKLGLAGRGYEYLGKLEIACYKLELIKTTNKHDMGIIDKLMNFLIDLMDFLIDPLIHPMLINEIKSIDPMLIRCQKILEYFEKAIEFGNYDVAKEFGCLYLHLNRIKISTTQEDRSQVNKIWDQTLNTVEKVWCDAYQHGNQDISYHLGKFYFYYKNDYILAKKYSLIALEQRKDKDDGRTFDLKYMLENIEEKLGSTNN